MPHALFEGFYSQVIVVSALEGFKLFYGLIGFVVLEMGIIFVKDFALQRGKAFLRSAFAEPIKP